MTPAGLLVAALLGFSPAHPLSPSRALSPTRAPAARRSSPVLSSGFGDKKIVGKEKAKELKPKRQGGTSYQNLKSAGQPEYDIFVRASDAEEWRPAGTLCAPRTSSVREAVSKAIYTREAELCTAVARAYPDLLPADADPASLQFGYRLAGFEDPVELAKRELAVDAKNFVQKWFSDLSDPINRE